MNESKHLHFIVFLLGFIATYIILLVEGGFLSQFFSNPIVQIVISALGGALLSAIIYVFGFSKSIKKTVESVVDEKIGKIENKNLVGLLDEKIGNPFNTTLTEQHNNISSKFDKTEFAINNVNAYINSTIQARNNLTVQQNEVESTIKVMMSSVFEQLSLLQGENTQLKEQNKELLNKINDLEKASNVHKKTNRDYER